MRERDDGRRRRSARIKMKRASAADALDCKRPRSETADEARSDTTTDEVRHRIEQKLLELCTARGSEKTC